MQNARLYALVTGVIAGTCLCSLITSVRYSAVFLCFGFVSITIVSCFFLHRTRISFFKNSVVGILFVACLFGAALGAGRTALWLSFNHGGDLDQLANKKVSLLGVVVEEPQMSDTSLKVIVKTLPNTANNFVRAKISVTMDRYSTVTYGDEIKLSGKIMIPKPIKSLKRDFAYDVYLARQGVFYTMTYPSMSILGHHQANIFREYLIAIKNNFLTKMNTLFPSPKSGLMAGLLVSGRSSLSKADQEQFTRAGLIHIVALSGFNVTIIVQAFMAVFIFLPKRIRLVLGALGIVAFVTMAGFGSTIVRAGIMALLVIASALVHRTYHVGRALFIAVLCMILWNPMVVFDVSFQLSCIATFAVIFAVNPALEKYSSLFWFLPEKCNIREIMLGTSVIELFLLPILLSTSGQISLVTVITNLLVLSILPIVMGFGFAATLLGYVDVFVALPLVAITNLMLEYILVITRFFAGIPFGVVSFSIPTWGVFVMYAALIFWLWRLQKHGLQKTLQEKTNLLLYGAPLTSQNLNRLDSFFHSHKEVIIK